MASFQERTIFDSASYTNRTLDPSDLSVDPRFKPYLSDNDAIESEVMTELNAARSGPVLEMTRIDDELGRLLSSIDALRRRRDGLKAALSAYDPLISAIRNVPDDVLETIFKHCLPTSRNARPFLFEAPLLLTLVCKRWRVIAYGSPQLWTTLHLSISFNYALSRSHMNLRAGSLSASPPGPAEWAKMLQDIRMAELEKWLSRSGTLPLSLSFFCPESAAYTDHYPEGDSTISDEARVRLQYVELATRHASRLSSLEIVIPHSMLESFDATFGGPENLPQLRQVKLMCDRMFYTPTDEHSKQPIGILSATLLQEISVKLHSDILHSANVQWPSNLTVLSLHERLDVGVAHHILVKCPNLQRCSLNINPYLGGGWGYGAIAASQVRLQPIRTTIRLHSLETLAVAGQIRTVGSFCRPFETPSLKHLLIFPGPYPSNHPPYPGTQIGPTFAETEDDVPYPPESTDSLCVYLSQCISLRVLTINPAHVLSPELQAIFHILPHIHTLVLDNSFTSTPGSKVITGTTLPDPCSSSFGHFMHNLDPLLKQERVSSTTGERTPIPHLLLPNLTSFTWNQFSLTYVPDDLFISFIKTRLPHPSTSTTLGPVPLKQITINLLTEPKTDISAEITRHAESIGLSVGEDFSLRVSTYPWASAMMFQPKPLYAAPKEIWEPSQTSDDNVIFNDDVTWPLFDI